MYWQRQIEIDLKLVKINYPDFWGNLNYDANSVTADPQFQDTSKNDYTVKPIKQSWNIF